MKKSFLVVTELGRIKNWVSMSLYQIKDNTPVFITNGQWGTTHRGTQTEITDVLLTDGLITQQEVEDASFSLTVIGANGLCFTEVQDGNSPAPVSDGMQKMLDLSTGHITAKTAKILHIKELLVDFVTGESKLIPVRWRSHEYGFTFWPTEPDVEKDWSNAPELEAINKYAYEHQCLLVNFDQDAEEVDLFEKFTW